MQGLRGVVIGLLLLGCGEDGSATALIDGSEVDGRVADSSSGDAALTIIPMECVELPAAAAAEPIAGLPEEPRLLWDVPLTFSEVSLGPVLTDDGLFVTDAPSLVHVSLDGEVQRSYLSQRPWALELPVATASNRVIAGNDVIEWLNHPAGSSPLEVSLGAPKDRAYQMVLSPSRLYVEGSDGVLRVIDPNDESGLLELRTEQHDGGVVFGFGDTLVAAGRDLGSWLWDAETLAPRGTPIGADGMRVLPILAARDVGIIGVEDLYRLGGAHSDIIALDRCGNEQWRLDATRFRSGPVLLGFGGDIYLVHSDESDIYTSVVSADGTPRASRTATGMPLALGADGILYSMQYSELSRSGRLIASDRDLREVWSLPIEVSRQDFQVVLTNDGVLAIAIAGDGSSLNRLIAVQTTSPGLAPTAWPSLNHDNRATRWIP